MLGICKQRRPVAFYVGNGKNNHHSCIEGVKLCLTGVKIS
jgi:hypothetical protein